MGILDQIAQPQMADIVGALDIRQKRLDADEAKRKEIRMGQLIAEAIPNLKPGSTLERMAKDDPKNFMLVTKAFGIPLNAGDQAQQLADDIDTLYQAAQTDPKDAYDRAIQLKAERNAKGLETPQIDKFLEGMEDDPQRTMTGLFVSHRSLNQEEYDKREMMKRKMDQEDRSLDIQEKRINTDRTVAGQGTADQKNWEQYQQLLKTDPAAAKKFAIATGFETTEGQKLSAFSEKEVSKASDAYTEATASANKYKTLASKLETSAVKGGVAGTWGEWIKEQTGDQDSLTALRKEALSISNSEAINNLPPGPATDRDIEIAKAPFPTEKADPKYVAKWLGAVARLREKEAEFNMFKADFISKNGTVRGKDGTSLAAAWKESQKAKQPVQESAQTQQDSTQKETAAQRYARLKGGN